LVVVDAGSDAEALDGSIDGAVDGGTEAPYEPPAGMAYLPALDGNAAVVIDINETTTAQYTECVTAGRCVAADRIVVRQDAVAVMGIDPATTPERLADGWVNRCNAVREAANHPINCVSHGQASDYCHFRHKRLPRAAEWKRITGSAAGRRFPWGDTQPECGTACFDLDGACLATAREVATCPSASRAGDRSPDGVLDLGGNVAEWLADAGERTGTGPAWRLIAGGSFIDGPTLLQGDSSRALPPTTAHVVLGFRCAVDGPTAATDDSGGTGGAGSGAAVDTTP